jgi:uncharacterized protein involved in exopolysaccharide biosynthesis
MGEGNQSRMAQCGETEVDNAISVEVPQASLLQIIWRRRWIVMLSVVAAVAGGFGYVLKATPIFTSSSRIYVEQVGPRILGDKDAGVSKSDSYLYTQAELLKSTPILASATESANARRMRSFEGVDNLIGYLKAALEVGVGKKDEIITVAFDSPFPEEAAQLVNSVVDAYVTYQSKQKKSTAAEVLKILRNEKEKRDTELDTKMKAALEYRKANGAVVVDYEKGNVIAQQMLKMYDALIQARVQTMDAKTNCEIAERALEGLCSALQLSADAVGQSVSRDSLHAAQYRPERVTRRQAERDGHGRELTVVADGLRTNRFVHRGERVERDDGPVRRDGRTNRRAGC